MSPVLRRAHPASLPVLEGIGLAGSVVVGLAIPLVFSSTAWLLSIAIFVVLIAALLLRRLMVGQIDPFEPLSVFVVMWSIMFAVRPVAMLLTGDFSLRDIYSARSAMSEALGLALVGCVAFVAGYMLVDARRPAQPSALVRARDLPARLPALLQNQHDRRVRTIALLFGAVGLITVLTSFAKGRSVEGTHSGYLIFAPLLLVPAALMLLDLKSGPRGLQRTVALVSLLLLTADNWLVGDRFFGLLPIGSLAIYECLTRRYRPSLVTVAGLLLALLVLLSLLVNARPSGPSASTAHEAGIKRFIFTDTTAELPGFAVQIETNGDLWHETPGYLPYSVILHSAPRQLWPAKPKSYEEILYSRLFPGSYAAARNGTEFSVLGDFYYDSGVPGILIGMTLLGLLLRWAYDRSMRRQTSGLSAVAYSMLPVLLVIVFRGDLTEGIAVVLYSYVPLYIARRYASRGVEGHVLPRSVHGRTGLADRPL